MSVLCCHIPDFLFAVTRRHEPELERAERPIALLGSDQTVWAASLPARAEGVRAGMSSHQARARCPDVCLRPLDTSACEAEHHALLGVLARTGLPTEAQDWGTVYVDLRPVTAGKNDAQYVCADLGRQVRRELGAALQPALGWDSGKFTACAAAIRCRPGQMRLIGPRDEASFLDPLPVTLLPLPFATAQQLDWLGIRTLGQFGRLPAAAVRQRFGPAGVLAQRWAQGHDDRPVQVAVNETPPPIEVDLDGPTASHDLALERAMQALRAPLKALATRLEGCRRVRLELRFADGSEQRADRALLEAACQPAILRAAIGQELRRAIWPAELAALRVILLDVAELKPDQLTLFAELDTAAVARAPLDTLVTRLSPRYGPAFARAQVHDAGHPVPERRFSFITATAHPPAGSTHHPIGG